jgi:hypothetical protein
VPASVLKKISEARIYTLFIPLLGIVLALNSYCDQSMLTRHQIALQKKIWRTEVNDMLYRNLIDVPTTGDIVTDYPGVKYLPGFESRAVIAELETVEEFSAGIALPGVRYALTRVRKPSRVDDILAAGLRSGTYQLIAQAKGFLLIKVR